MDNIIFTITNKVSVPYCDLQPQGELLDDMIYNGLTISNPAWIENNRFKRFNLKTPKKLFFYEEVGKDDLYIPRGFLPEVIDFCKKNNIKYKIDDQTYFFDDIDFQFNGKLRNYQKTAVKKMLSKNIGTLCAPTGSGKTIMGIYILAERKQPTIVLVHTKELLYQWVNRITQFLNIDRYQIGLIGDKNFDENKDITIALIQTFRKYPQKINQYSHLIVDENHRIPSKTHTHIVSNFKGKYILGLSATPYRRDGLGKLIEWYAGPIWHEIPPRDLIDEGQITGVEAIIRETEFISKLEDPSAEYSKLMSEIANDKKRNLMICEDVAKEISLGSVCLVLTDRKHHCQKLHEILIDKYNVNMPILNGDTSKEKREKLIESINNNKIPGLIATGQLIGEGFDCKNLGVLFLTMPVKFTGRIIQYVGRVLRPAKGKEVAYIYDYMDLSVRCLHSGMRTRKKLYKEMEV